ncbi:YqiJ family protein [Pelagibius sp. Alg239-R121]|uniref:YqiJ family protein n=1 Tax=Pelagibius sp. Alg239-R121 TaxID=2993448 RepID=UPI0024A6EB9F|nr:YqiJ family protein [Pelagibius sp. Alg239-R121]
MIDLLLASDSRPFSVALAMMSGLAVLEIGFLLGGLGGISQLIDAVLPEGLSAGVDLDLDADIEADADLPDGNGPSFLQGVLGFFGIGTVPFLVVLVAFLTSFGLVGLAEQYLVKALTGTYLPATIASMPALILGSSLSGRIALFFGRLIPSVETDAVSSETFVGRVARITVGTAQQGQPAQARLHDQKGHSHVVLVEPDQDHQTLPEGSSVLLVSRESSIFRAIPAPSDSLYEQ